MEKFHRDYFSVENGRRFLLYRRLKLPVLILVLSLITIAPIYSQENKDDVTTQPKHDKSRVITGKITTKKENQPLYGASVVISGTKSSALTDANGQFKITTDIENPSLEISYLGYKKVTIKVGNNNVVNVEMVDNVSEIGELTVVAYGTRDKKELISSVAKVKAADIDDLPTASLETLLQGHMSGVEVNNISGSPGGGGSSVRIRGYNSLMDGSTESGMTSSSKKFSNQRDGSPLYVVDGVPVNSYTSSATGMNMLANIDPSTIASVEVLKDAASAALYGSRASNGVILITTKQGRPGESKFTVNATHSYSILPETPVQVIGNDERRYFLKAFQSMVKGYYDNSQKKDIIPSSYIDTYGKYQGQYDYFWNNGQTWEKFITQMPYTDSLNPFYNNSSNFWKTTFQPGRILNANINASGGSDNLRYMIGAGAYKEKGIMVASDFSRYNFMTNISVTPVKNFKMDARVALGYTERISGSANGSLSTSSKITGLTATPKGTSSLYPSIGVVADNILKEINGSSSKNTSLGVRASINGAYTIMPGLVLTSMLSTDYNASHMNYFQMATSSVTYGSQSTGTWNDHNVLTNENLLTYSKTISNKHNIDLLAGTGYTREGQNLLLGSGKGGPNNNVHYVGEGWPSTYPDGTTIKAAQSFLSDFTETEMMSYIGRIAYNYDRRYLVEATFRRDGSSTFAENRRWADFPSVAVGWNFSDEKFMKNAWWLNFGKLRASWGVTGQTFGDPYLAHGTWTTGASFLGNIGLSPDAPLNLDLSWENTAQYNVGLDLELFNQRVRFKTDYYYKYSSSVLNFVDAPGDVYYHKKSFQNVMEISNEGIEFEVAVDIIRKTDLRWTTKLNLSRNWNRLEKVYTDTDLDRNNSLLVIGLPIYGLYARKSLGIIQNEEDIPKIWNSDGSYRLLRTGTFPYMPGMRLYEDLNGDGLINDYDKYYAGSTLPLIHGGISSELSWRSFDLNVLFTFSLGRNLINNYAYPSAGFSTSSLAPLFINPNDFTFWNKPGDGNTDYPSLAVSNSGSAYIDQYVASASSSQIEKVNFIRCKQLTLGYTLPGKWSKQVNINALRMFFTAENLFLLTNYSGVDPEVVNPSLGYDNFTNYPLARKLTIGLSINF